MTISLTNESKNEITLTKKDKGLDKTWAESDPTEWGDQSGAWGTQLMVVTNKTKNSIALTNKSK